MWKFSHSTYVGYYGGSFVILQAAFFLDTGLYLFHLRPVPFLEWQWKLEWQWNYVWYVIKYEWEKLGFVYFCVEVIRHCSYEITLEIALREENLIQWNSIFSSGENKTKHSSTKHFVREMWNIRMKIKIIYV